jgi:DNA repair protein RadC
MACGLPRFARIDDRRSHLQRKSTVCGITGFLSATADPSPIISSTPASAGLLRYVLFPPAAPACLRFQTKNMQQPIFQFGSEPQNTSNPLASSSHCSSVQERLVTYGSEALDTAEHLGLILGSQKAADVLLDHFGSLAVLARASVEELLPFVSSSKALRLVSSLRMGAVALREERQSLTIDSPEAIADLCSEMRFLDREWLRVVLLNTKQQLIKVATVSQGSVNESLAHPREVFKPAIVLSAYSFILVHNHPSGDPSPSEADMRLTRRILEGSRLLQLHLVDHVIIGMPAPGRSSYFSFKEAGVIS